MRIAFLHLSDIHFEANDKEYNARIDRIVNALRTLGGFSELFIIVSGDIAHSGEINQYRTANRFFRRLGDLCKKTYNLAQFPRFLLVPGNHDVTLSKDPSFLATVQQAYTDKNVESLYAKEMEKQLNFFDFAKEFDCPFNAENSVLRKSYQLNNLSIEFILIDSAAFSMRELEKGLHYLPEDALEEACRASKADYVFYVMHHSYHWFNDVHKSRLEDEILRNANVLFVGHEHHPGNQGITHNENSETLILAGGMLANRGDWFASDFAAYTLDTEAMETNWIGYSFHWKKRSKLYVESRRTNAMIQSRKSLDSEIPPIKPDYLSDLMHDEKLTENFSLDQYFVFPRLEKRDSDYAAPEECSTMDDFLRLLDKERKIVISGPTNSGKTTLLRSVIKQLMDTKMVVYCSSNDVTSGNRNRIIKNIVSEMYGDDQDQYTAFLQLPKEKKVLLIDDSNLIGDRNRASFLADLGSDFGYIIIMRNEFLNLDIQEQIRIDAIGDYARYSLSPFYVDKRNTLIHKLVPLFAGNGENYEEIAETICDALRHQRITTYFTPDLVFQLTMYFCKHMAEATRNDGSIFDKVFEANLIKQIEPYIKTRAITIGKLLVILDKIAYHIHVNKLYPIPESEIIKVIEDYKSDYGSNVSIQQVLQTITESNVIRQDPRANAFYFTNKSTLVYFIAREIRSKYSETHDETDLRNVLTYCCFGINADILMMLTYITEDAGMLNILLNMALVCVEGWEEISIDQKNIPLLSAGSSPTVVVLEDNVAQKQSEQELAREKKATQLSAKNEFGIYSYEEKDVELLANQLSRAISLMVVVARCLPSFEHLMRAPAKKQFVSAIYELPQKIFYRWASAVELIKEDLVEQLYDMHNEAQKNNDRLKVPAKAQLAERIQAEALCQYLNILYIPVLYSTRPHTVEYLNDFDYSRSSSYGIMHGMILERCGKIDELYGEMEKLFEKTDNVVVQYLIRKIMQHSIVFSKKISQAQVQRIEEKFLDGGKGHQKRLVARKSKQ